MRNFLIAFALIAASASVPANEADSWHGRDKKMHAGVSAIIGFAARQQWPNEPGKAFAVALVPGVIKELSDGRRASAKDMVANALGAAVGVYAGGWLVRYSNGHTTISYSTEF